MEPVATTRTAGVGGSYSRQRQQNQYIHSHWSLLGGPPVAGDVWRDGGSFVVGVWSVTIITIVRLASVIERAAKPTQTKNQPRNIKATQLYNTPSDVQTQHDNFLQLFSVTHVEKMLRFYRPQEDGWGVLVTLWPAARSDTMECVVQATFCCGCRLTNVILARMDILKPGRNPPHVCPLPIASGNWPQ